MLEFINIVEYFDSITQAINFCQNMYWTPHAENEHIKNACAEVWGEYYINNK